MKKIINFWKRTKSIEFMIKLFFAGIFNRIWVRYQNAKMVKIAENILCKRPYLINTDFGNYIWNSMMTYFLLNENYEPEIKKVIEKCWEKNRGKNSIMLNIWCNIWRRAIDCAKNFNYNVIAFEPAPEIYDTFVTNVALSRLVDKVMSYNIALWSDNSTMKFWYNKYINNGSSHIITWKSKYDYDWWVVIEVPVRRFDDLWIDDQKIEGTRLIIMDVEWFELNVLKWMKNTLKKFHDIDIIMEIRDDQKNKDSVITLMEWLWYIAKQIDKDDRLFTK